MKSDISRLIQELSEIVFIIAVLGLILWVLFTVVARSVPPEPTPDSVEMGAPR